MIFTHLSQLFHFSSFQPFLQAATFFRAKDWSKSTRSPQATATSTTFSPFDSQFERELDNYYEIRCFYTNLTFLQIPKLVLSESIHFAVQVKFSQLPLYNFWVDHFSYRHLHLHRINLNRTTKSLALKSRSQK